MVVIATKHEKNLVQCFTKIKIIFVHSIVPDIFVTIRNMMYCNWKKCISSSKCL